MPTLRCPRCNYHLAEIHVGENQVLEIRLGFVLHPYENSYCPQCQSDIQVFNNPMPVPEQPDPYHQYKRAVSIEVDPT